MPSTELLDRLVPEGPLTEEMWVTILKDLAAIFAKTSRLSLGTLGSYRCLRRHFDRDECSGEIGFKAEVRSHKRQHLIDGLTEYGLTTHGVFGQLEEYGGFNRDGKGVRHLWGLTSKGKWIRVVVHYHKELLQKIGYDSGTAVADRVEIFPTTIEEILRFSTKHKTGSFISRRSFDVLSIYATLEEQRKEWNKRLQEMRDELNRVNDEASFPRKIVWGRVPEIRGKLCH